MSQLIQSTLLNGYSIDTCALIDLKPYPRDIFEKLWVKLEKLIAQGLLISPREVLAELKKRDDIIAEWTRNNSKIFVSLDPVQMIEVRTILAEFPTLIDPNKITADADPFVIALAKSRKWAVITSEKPRRSPDAKPKIPDVCMHYGIECYSLFDFFRKIGWKF